MVKLIVSDSVFCGNFDKTGRYIVTGGQDEVAYVYDIAEEEVKFTCTGISFSFYFSIL